jgi:hypothetical protein
MAAEPRVATSGPSTSAAQERDPQGLPPANGIHAELMPSSWLGKCAWLLTNVGPDVCKSLGNLMRTVDTTLRVVGAWK